MPAFLSPDWFADLAERLRTAPPLEGEGALRLGQLVPDAPEGEVRYTLALAAGKVPTLMVGTTEDSDVVLVEKYEAARALASGERAAAELLEAGEVTLRGDAAALVRAMSLLEQAVAVLSPPPSRDRHATTSHPRDTGG